MLAVAISESHADGTDAITHLGNRAQPTWQMCCCCLILHSLLTARTAFIASVPWASNPCFIQHGTKVNCTRTTSETTRTVAAEPGRSAARI